MAEFAPVIPQFDMLRFSCDTHTWEACSLLNISPLYVRDNVVIQVIQVIQVTQMIQMIQISLEMHQEHQAAAY